MKKHICKHPPNRCEHPSYRIPAPIALAVLLLAGSAGVLLAVARLCVRPPETPDVPAREIHPTAVSAAPVEDLPEIRTRNRRPYCYTVLLTGVDEAGGGSDTDLLLRFDAGLGRIDLVSLPRDTLLHHEWYSNKLNYAYASGGISLLRKEVETLLGIPVDFSVTVDLQGFAGLVDGLGGIDFYVPADMDYDDDAQGLHIHFAKGPRHLDGQQAMEVVRWRKNNDGSGYADADLGRIATQQAFLRACAEKAAKIGSVPVLARLFFTHVHTDLSAGNLVWLGTRAMEIGADQIRFHTLPGNGAGYYRGESVYVLDPEATLSLVNEALDPYDAPIGPEEMDILVPQT